MANGSIESSFLWIFGTAAALDQGRGSPNNVLGSTGAGVAFNTRRLGSEFSFFVDTDGAATCSYQIRTGPTSSGPWAVVSSGTLSTSACDLVQIPGPLRYLSPRLKTINSTANQVAVRMTAI